LRNDATLWRAQVSIESDDGLPGGPASSAARAATFGRLALCCALVVAATSVGIATSGWGLRERLLLAVVVLAAIVGVLLRRHRLSDQKLAAER
jgi:hypothetical protein